MLFVHARAGGRGGIDFPNNLAVGGYGDHDFTRRLGERREGGVHLSPEMPPGGSPPASEAWTWENAAAGAAAGFTTVAALHPLDVVRTRFQGNPSPRTIGSRASDGDAERRPVTVFSLVSACSERREGLV